MIDITATMWQQLCAIHAQASSDIDSTVYSVTGRRIGKSRYWHQAFFTRYLVGLEHDRIRSAMMIAIATLRRETSHAGH